MEYIKQVCSPSEALFYLPNVPLCELLLIFLMVERLIPWLLINLLSLFKGDLNKMLLNV